MMWPGCLTCEAQISTSIQSFSVMQLSQRKRFLYFKQPEVLILGTLGSPICCPGAPFIPSDFNPAVRHNGGRERRSEGLLQHQGLPQLLGVKWTGQHLALRHGQSGPGQPCASKKTSPESDSCLLDEEHQELGGDQGFSLLP